MLLQVTVGSRKTQTSSHVPETTKTFRADTVCYKQQTHIRLYFIYFSRTSNEYLNIILKYRLYKMLDMSRLYSNICYTCYFLFKLW